MELIQRTRELAEFQRIVSALQGHAKLYLVGGLVRDALMGIHPTDLDIATDLPPTQIMQVLQRAGIRVVPTGIEHGTVTAVVEHQHVEITTFRAPSARNETKYSTTIEEDLAGRDFTINAIAFDLSNEVIIDPFDGCQDLTRNHLQCVGSPTDRFQEDPLRILRMLRFGPAQARSVEPETLQAAANCAPLLAQVSVERIREELCKILLCEDPASALIVARDLSLLKYVVPELLPAVGCEQNRYHIEDVFEHTLSVLRRTQKDLLVRLTALFHDIGKPHTISVGDDGERHFYQHEIVGADICRIAMMRLKFSKEITNDTSKLVEYHMRPLEVSPATVRRLIRDLGPLLEKWRHFKWADKSPTLSEEDFEKQGDYFDSALAHERARRDYHKRTSLVINGRDLQALGIPPGPGMGKIIAQLKELILDDPSLNEREVLLQEASKMNRPE